MTTIQHRQYRALGIMSGSSLDGLDLAFCAFTTEKEKANSFQLKKWELIRGETLPFSTSWKQQLAQLHEVDARSFLEAHTEFGHYVGQKVLSFLHYYQLEPDFIAFHGHTIFHDPKQHYTVQIGDGAALAAITGLPVINQFRHQDVALQGQGAPLAAIADRYLLQAYDFCLNLGGIANITAQLPGKYLAFDICPANQILNALVSPKGLEYDKDGDISARGSVSQQLLDQLNASAYYQKDYPKTLDNFWGRTHVLEKIKKATLPIEDQLRTAVEHIVQQIKNSLTSLIRQEPFPKKAYRLIPTGGGVFNKFLIQRLTEELSTINIQVEIPDNDFVNFKEAVLMALMGVLRVENIPNILPSVTGARRASIGGAIHQGYLKKL